MSSPCTLDQKNRLEKARTEQGRTEKSNRAKGCPEPELLKREFANGQAVGRAAFTQPSYRISKKIAPRPRPGGSRGQCVARQSGLVMIWAGTSVKFQGASREIAGAIDLGDHGGNGREGVAAGYLQTGQKILTVAQAFAKAAQFQQSRAPDQTGLHGRRPLDIGSPN